MGCIGTIKVQWKAANPYNTYYTKDDKQDKDESIYTNSI